MVEQCKKLPPFLQTVCGKAGSENVFFLNILLIFFRVGKSKSDSNDGPQFVQAVPKANND